MANNEKSFLNTISFFALVGIGLVLLLTELSIFNLGKVQTIINSVAHAIAYGILAINGYKFVKPKTTAWKVTYAVALTLIVIVLVFPVIKAFKA